MKKRLGILLVTATLSCGAASISAQVAKTALPAQCKTKVIPYSAWQKVKNPAWSFDAKTTGGGRLFYYGTPRHTRETSDPIFDEIEKAWNEVKPTAAFYEGGNRPIGATREETIKIAGESGFVRFLAKRDNVPYLTLEPAPQDEVNYILAQKFTREQTLLFFVLRETARLRDRENMTEPQLKKAVVQILAVAKQFKGFETTMPDLNALDAAYKKYWKTPANWWEAPQKWFNPLDSSKTTGGVFTNEINQASSHFRNQYMAEILSKAALEGKTVFAVVGRNHVPMQIPALNCALTIKK